MKDDGKQKLAQRKVTRSNRFWKTSPLENLGKFREDLNCYNPFP